MEIYCLNDHKVLNIAAVYDYLEEKYNQDKPFTTLDLIYHLIDCLDYIGGMPQELVIDQDSIMVASENAGDIIYTEKFSSFIEDMELKMYLCRRNVKSCFIFYNRM